jgi:hypothetical protein
MIRIFLARGDRAKSAVITEGFDFVTCSNPPPAVHLATVGMRTYCSACKREGYIAPRGPRWPGTAQNGKQWALSGDVNICACDPAPVFYPSRERHMTMSFTADEVRALMAGDGAAIGRMAERNEYDQHFRLLDQRTREPMPGVAYRIATDDGEVIEGLTDSQGHTRRVSGNSSLPVTIHVMVDETPIDPYWDRYL